MIPIGYMAKNVKPKPTWLDTDRVVDIYSVSDCVSKDFDEYIKYWKHNGYWLFDSPKIIIDIASENQIDISNSIMFYYEAYKLQYDEYKKSWDIFSPDKSFQTNVIRPKNKKLEGYDVVSFSSGTAPECSYLSCNHMAEELEVNQHCLFNSLEEAIRAIESGVFQNCEPGPCRIFAVYTL